MNPAIEIEFYQPRYKAGILELIVDIQRKEFGIRITAEDQPDLNEIPEYYQAGLGNFWVARSNQRIIGTISILDIGDGNGALRKMFVHKDFRGSEQGVAKQLLDTLLPWCSSQKILKIYLGTTPKFLAAHRFYEKNGFVEIEKHELPSSFPIMRVDTKFYSYNILHQQNRVSPN